jgi:hypothetical protein
MEFKELFTEIEKIVNEIDPVKIAYLSEDEYINEIYAITEKVYAKTLTLNEIKQIVKKVFIRFFSEDYITDEDCEKIGERIYKILTF